MRVTVLAALVLLTLLAAPASASEAGCTATATVGWEVDFDALVLDGATVDAPGCEDGSLVGLQLITDDGDLPADEPLISETTDARATFDLTHLSPAIEPVTGVRVFLFGDQDRPLLEITVDQRFFNRPGSEQIGLRSVTVLRVEAGGQYQVPEAPAGYAGVECAGVGLDPGADALDDEGAGTFTATESGVHLVCYRQLPGAPGGPSTTEEPEVLGEVLVSDGDDVQVLGRVEVRGDDDAGGPSGLATTGVSISLSILVGLMLLVGGLRLARWRR